MFGGSVETGFEDLTVIFIVVRKYSSLDYL